MVLHAVLVFDDLAIQFVDQRVDGSIKVMRNTFDVEIFSFDVNVDFSFLPFFLFCQFVYTEDDIIANESVRRVYLGEHFRM